MGNNIYIYFFLNLNVSDIVLSCLKLPDFLSTLDKEAFFGAFYTEYCIHQLLLLGLPAANKLFPPPQAILPQHSINMRLTYKALSHQKSGESNREITISMNSIVIPES